MGIVYQARNTINGKRYVGKTVRCLGDRRSCHERDAGRGSKLAFHRALRKYGKEAFEWSVLMHDDDENDLSVSEILAIWMLKTKVPNGYNLTDGGEGGSDGSNLTDDGRRAIGEVGKANKGKKRSPEFCKKVGNYWRNRKRSDENKEKLRIANVGKKLSEETRIKIGLAGRGRKQSCVTIARRKASLKGHATSAATKEKIRQALLAPEGNAKLKEAAVKNRQKRIDSLRRHNRYRDWESCSM